MSVEKAKHEAARWLQQARADIRAAESSIAAGVFEWACFQSQQAAEKALKAFWLNYSADPWGHSLLKLIETFPDDGLRAPISTLLPQAKALDKLYIPTRYPNGLPDSVPSEVYTEPEARSAIDAASQVIEAVAAAIA
jgi:HEPN domain-containing protein